MPRSDSGTEVGKLASHGAQVLKEVITKTSTGDGSKFGQAPALGELLAGHLRLLPVHERGVGDLLNPR
jgi:hypothetical protein